MTIRNCRFTDCTSPVLTGCGFQPTKNAPYYHENIRFLHNTVVNPAGSVMALQNVRGVEYRDNTVTGLRDGKAAVALTDCDGVTIR